MTADRMPLTAEQQERVNQELANLAKATKTDAALLAQVFAQALRSSTFDEKTILSRMSFLLGRDGGKPFGLPAGKGEKAAADMARHLLYPKEAVFACILRHAPLAPGKLAEIYDCIRGRSPGHSLLEMDDLSEERILQEMKWWIVDVGFPKYYFDTTPAAGIAHQIVFNRYHELQGMDSESYANLKVSYTSPSGTALHWVHSDHKFLEIESRIENEYYQGRNCCDIAVYAYRQLYLYLAEGGAGPKDGDQFEAVAPPSLLQRESGEMLDRYRTMWSSARRQGGIVVAHSDKPESGEKRLMVSFPARFINHFLANLSRVLKRNRIAITRKYIATFAGNVPVIVSSFYARQAFPANIQEELVEVGLYPDNRVARLVEGDVLSPREAVFANAVVDFVHQFITRAEPNLLLLRQRFAQDPELRETLQALQRRMDKDNYSFSMILEAFVARPDIVRQLYAIFAERFDPDVAGDRLPGLRQAFERNLAALALNQDEAEIFRWGLFFVEAVERTNFFLPVKAALSFRLRRDFLARHDYRVLPHGVFFIKGRNFTGFHVRFKDIARGGIRIIRSATHDDYQRNADYLFEECYNLAFTQNHKNKDIPEGGAKGVILLRLDAAEQLRSEAAFKNYVDAILDLLLPENRDFIRNFEEEILFLGPDEGSAELMDWACERAHARNYRYWKGFTTGKHARLGGVSHIDYGMTTNSVRQYVLGLFAKLGVKESQVTKAQTGGPDGDLGGNEILAANDRTTVVIDGGGVLYDPAGLDREELRRLARARQDSSRFDPAKLGQGGFLVRVADQDVTLPDGSKVASGLSFRNGFHLDPRLRADLFMPCGGRPKSINGTNWQSLLDADGHPIFKWIVEGANLFITGDARLKLEAKGVILFKDSSTNKGGVTSSSLEVLAGLALTDQEFDEWMVVGADGAIPEFRRRYIEEILKVVRDKAKAEFEILWRLHQETGEPYSILSDRLSDKINEVTVAVEQSILFESDRLRRNLMALHLPPLLQQKVGMDQLLERIPDRYQRAICARALASSFVYRFGINPGYEDYRRYVEELGKAKPVAKK